MESNNFAAGPPNNNPSSFPNVEIVANTDWQTVELNGETVEIPVGWRLSTPKKEGFRIKTGNKNANEGSVDGKYEFYTCSTGAVFKINSCPFNTEAILINGNGNVGHIRYANGKFDAYQRVYVVDNIPQCVYFYLYFKKYFQNNLNKLGGAMPYIKIDEIENFTLIIPPLPEQNLIANLLSTQEDHIASLKQRASLERKKLAFLTDELLSGRILVEADSEGEEVVVTRDENGNPQEVLPAVRLVANNDWQTVELNGETVEIPVGWTSQNVGQIAVVSAGQSPNGSSVVAGDVKDDFLDFHQGNSHFDNKYTKFSGKVVSKNDAPKICGTGDILLSVRAPVGAINFASHPLCFGRGLCSIKATTSDKEFLYFSIKQSRDALTKNANGSTFEAVKISDVAELELAIPSFSEQKNIATVLVAQENHVSNIEMKISCEEKRLAWLSDNLLTGKTLIKEK